MSATLDLQKLPPGLRIEVADPAELGKPEVRAKLRVLIERVRANPLLTYYPHAKQAPFHAIRRPIKMFIGGERSGKTVAGVLDDIIQAVDRDVLPPHLQPYKIWDPPFYCRLITPDFGQQYQEILRTLQEWVPRDQLHLGEWGAAYLERNHVLNFANGSFIEFMSQEQDVMKFGGTSRHRIHYDEEPKGAKGEKIREANVNRLIQYRGDELFTFSPVHGLGRLGEDLWEQKGEEIQPEVFVNEEMVVVVADQDDNLHLDQQGKEEANRKIPERMRAARKSGKFVHAAGLVYEGFWDPELIVCDPLDAKFVEGLERFEVIDPGLNTAVLFAGFVNFSKNGERWNDLWIYDEYFTDRDYVPERVADVIRRKRREWTRAGKQTIKPRRVLMDPFFGAAKQSQTGETTAAAYKRAGIRSRAAKANVDGGIFEVMRRMEHKDAEGNPAPLIHIASNCKRLIWELGRYRKKENEDGELEIVKVDDHAVDCMRYLANEKPLPGHRKRMRTVRRLYVPGTAPPIDQYPPERDVGAMGKFS